MKDFAYYKKVLKITGSYNEESLKKAFYSAVKANHPDKFKNPINKKLATEKMKIINEAYEYLKKNIDNQPSGEEFNDYSNETKQNNYSKHTEEKEYHKEEQQSSDTVKDLEQYIRDHTIITITYKLKTGEVVNLKILPLELKQGLYKQDFMYLKALFCSQNKVKTYRVDRIINITVGGEESNSETKKFYNNSEDNKYYNENEKSVWNLTVLLPIITAIVIIISFFKVPYTIYIILRVLVCLTLLNMIITLRKFLPIGAILLCIGGIVLYNPLYLVHLSKGIWQLLDIGLLVIILYLLKGYFKDE